MLDDFVKTLLVSQMAISTDRQMEKFQERFLRVMSPLSRPWRGMEDVLNESSEEVTVIFFRFLTT